MSLAAVVLAGGESRRMGQPKALLPYAGETFLDRLVGIFEQVCSQVVVVLGNHADRITAGVVRTPLFVRNPQPERGQLTSLQCGFAALRGPYDAVFFTPVDFPSVKSETVELLARHAAEDCAAVVPEFGSRHGHPVLIRRQLAEEILLLDADDTARTVIHRHVPRTRYVPVDDPGVLLDVDDPQAYQALMQASR